METFTLEGQWENTTHLTTLKKYGGALSTESYALEESTVFDTTLNSTGSFDVFLPWNNPYNIISYEAYLLVETIFVCGLNIGLCLIGIFTNIVNLIVFYRQRLRDRMNLCLFSLAFADLGNVMMSYMFSSFCLVRWFKPEATDWWEIITRVYFTGFYKGFVFISGCMTMIIAVERCLCVLMPLKAATLISTRSIGIIIVSVFVIIQTICCIYPLQLQVNRGEDPKTGQIRTYLSTTAFFEQNRKMYDVIQNTLLMIVVPVVTFIGVSVATIITVIQIKRAILWRQETSTDSQSTRREVALVKMLVIVSCIYIATSAPGVALGFSRLLVAEFVHNRRYSNIYISSHRIYLSMAMLNSSVNFFVYVARSSKYRRELYKLLLLCPLRKTPRIGSVSGLVSDGQKDEKDTQLSMS